MLKSLVVLPILFLALSVTACGQATKDVNPTEAKKMIEKGNVVVVDVRTTGEWNGGHLKGAKHIDISSPDFDAKISKLKKSDNVIVYCAVGGRSSRAASMMAKKGFTNVYNMAGGYNGWSAKGYPTEK